MLAIYDKLEGAVGKALRAACAALFGAILAIVLLNILDRFVPLFDMAWFEEVITLCFAWMMFLGAAELTRQEKLFNVDFFLKKLSRRPRLSAGARCLIDTLCLCFSLVLLLFGAKWIRGIHSSTAALAMPSGVLYACIPVSMALMTLMSARDLVRDLAASVRGD